MPRSREENWRRRIRKVTRLAKRIEGLGLHRRHARQEPLAAVIFAMLIQMRRLAEAIDRLGYQQSYEAHILLRSMMETWVNARWITLKEPQRRAHRFVSYELIERMTLAKQIPQHERPADYEARVRELRRQCRPIRHLFYKRFGAGRKWAEHWAITKSDAVWKHRTSLLARLEDIEEEMQGRKVPADDSALYFTYRMLNRPTHGSPYGLNSLVEVTLRGVRANRNPIPSPFVPIKYASTFLLELCGHAQDALKTNAYTPEYKSLVEELMRSPES